MKKLNKLTVAVTTTKIYEYGSSAETEDIALDEFYNDSAKRIKLISTEATSYEIREYKIHPVSEIMKKEETK